jgi:flagellar motor switch protein FliM
MADKSSPQETAAKGNENADGPAQLSVAQIEGLRPGDVIRTSAPLDDPAVVFVVSKPKYLAYPFAAEDGEVRLKVAKKIPPKDESRYA